MNDRNPGSFGPPSQPERIRVQVDFRSAGGERLLGALARMPPRSRAGRIRHYAFIGLMVSQGKLGGVASPAAPAHAAATESEVGRRRDEAPPQRGEAPPPQAVAPRRPTEVMAPGENVLADVLADIRALKQAVSTLEAGQKTLAAELLIDGVRKFQRALAECRARRGDDPPR